MTQKLEYREIDLRNQHQNETDKLNSQLVKLTQEKRDLENELSMFINEKKETITKCESQMNEILQMVNEERLVRSHLKSLATKLIEEVDQLRSQCIYTTPTSLTTSTNVNNGTHNEQWKNRNSEKRDRINVINLQVMLRKETQAKLDLIDENRTLKDDIDTKQNQISELKDQIDVYLTEIKNLNDKLEEINVKKDQTTNMNINNNSNQHLNGHLSNSNEAQLQLDCLNECGSSTVLINSIMEPSKPLESSLKHSKSLKDYNNETNTKLSTFSSKTLDPATVSHVKSHRFEVVTFNTMERCEYCCGILYGVCRQAVRCKEKNCNYLCHSKCRANLPENCPININQRVQLKGVDFNRGIGTLMQGSLKIPKLGTVKKGWQDHYVVLSNARLFICPIVDSKTGLIPVQIIDIRDPQFDVGPVNDYDVIHANKRDIPCIFRIFASKLKSPDSRQQILFCAKDENDKNNWITMLRDLNQRLKIMSRTQNSLQSIIFVSFENLSANFRSKHVKKFLLF
jgi:serine/threonine-protein kinase MRCK